MDSDDWVRADMYEILYNKTLHSKFDLVACNMILVSNGAERIVNRYTEKELKNDIVLDIPCRRRLLVKGGSVGTTIFRRELIVDNQLFFPDKVFYEDNYWVSLTFFNANSFSFVEESLYYYFRNNDTSTTSRRNSLHHLDRLKTSQLLRETLMSKDVDAEYMDEIEYLYITLNYRNTVNLLIEQFSKIDYKLITNVRDKFLQIYPRYYRNHWYKRYEPLLGRLLLRLNDKHVYIYAFVYLLLRHLRCFLSKIKRRVINSTLRKKNQGRIG